MNRRITFLIALSLLGMLSAAVAQPQDEPAPPPQQQGQAQSQGAPGQGRGGRESGGPRVFGRITAMNNGTMEITGPDGQAVTVKVTPQTEFRKDREPAKASDFKVGDMVFVRGDKNADNTVTASMIGARSGGPGLGGRPGGQGAPGGDGMNLGTLGKDYVAGEVKSIDAPKLTVLRTDNVTQMLELNEDTSLRRGRESITMADIKVGDHIMARGAANGEVFVPKGLMVMTPEMWQRMQQYAASGANSNGNSATPGTDGSAAPAPKPQE